MSHSCEPRSKPKKAKRSWPLETLWNRLQDLKRREFLKKVLATVVGGWIVKWLPGPKENNTRVMTIERSVSDGLNLQHHQVVVQMSATIHGSAEVGGTLTTERLA